MSYRPEGSSNKYTGMSHCDGVKGIMKYGFRLLFYPSFMLQQHIPKTYRRMNDFLPHHLYYNQETMPFEMKCIPASNICNRSVIKRFVYMKQEGGHYTKVSPKSIAWMPENDYVVTAWSNGTIVKFEAVTYKMGKQRSVFTAKINYY